MNPRRRVFIAGRGRVGRGLAHALASTAIDVTLVSGRAGQEELSDATRESLASGSATLVLAVPDAAIGSALARFAPLLGAGSAVLHCAGARGVEAFGDGVRPNGVLLGGLHPLVSFADAAVPPRVRGAGFGVCGEPAAVDAAREIVDALSGIVLPDVQGPRYHAGAALVANGAAALGHHGARLYSALGVPPDAAAAAVGALLVSVGENLVSLGAPEALSGPVRRGDVGTVARHREALATHPEALAAYDALLPLIVETARELGLPEARVADFLALFPGLAREQIVGQREHDQADEREHDEGA